MTQRSDTFASQACQLTSLAGGTRGVWRTAGVFKQLHLVRELYEYGTKMW